MNTKEKLLKIFPNVGYKYFVYLTNKRINKDKNSIRKYIEKKYFNLFNQKLDLDNPTSFYEKVNYLKLHQDIEGSETLVDKITAKEIAEKSGFNIKTAKLISCFDSFKDFKAFLLSKDMLKQCVVKLNHTSGDVFFYNCGKWKEKHGQPISQAEVFACLRNKIKLNYYCYNFEKCYLRIKPKIIIEEYLPSLGGLAEYKIICNYGIPKLVNVVYGRQKGSDVSEAFADINLNKLPVYQDQPIIDSDDIFVPSCWSEMIEFAKKMSAGFPMLRVDMLTDGKVFYFCEFTFYDFGGNAIFYPLDWNYKIGDLFDIGPFIKNVQNEISSNTDD